MNTTLNIGNFLGWLVGFLVVTIGILNLIFVHPVPAIAYLILSCVYLPPVNTFIRIKTGFTIPLLTKIFLGLLLIIFTLGVSDLGDMIDKL